MQTKTKNRNIICTHDSKTSINFKNLFIPSLANREPLSKSIFFGGPPLLLSYLHLPPFFPQCDKSPEPCNHFKKGPCEEEPILEPLAPRTWMVSFRGIYGRPIGEEVRIRSEDKEDSKSERCYCAEILVRYILLGENPLGDLGLETLYSKGWEMGVQTLRSPVVL